MSDATSQTTDLAGNEEAGTDALTPPLTANDLGFTTIDERSWRKRLGEREVIFRRLRRLPELLMVEGLQREVFRVTDRDLAAASQLVVVPETGGEVLGAFVAGEAAAREEGESAPAEEPVGFVVGWGGYLDGRPRLLSDMLGVRVDLRGSGLGAELKALQAAVAVERGFSEIVWTVDPLRAPNARLNFEKLGATANRYEEDRYGADYAAGLYGGLPTDRLHVSWSLDSPRVRNRLLGRPKMTTLADIAGLTHFDPAGTADRALVYFPADIDRIMTFDPNLALRWRLTLRETLPLAFALGFKITGFVAEVDEEQDYVSYVIER
jgi:predicted GNAT superfamily acetyltransferase